MSLGSKQSLAEEESIIKALCICYEALIYHYVLWDSHIFYLCIIFLTKNGPVYPLPNEFILKNKRNIFT